MTDREIRQELKQIRDSIFNTNCELSKFNDRLHEDELETIHENEDALIENDIAVNDRITQIEDALIELDEQINGGINNG